MAIAIVVHGGAGILSPDKADAAQGGCKDAALIGWRVLQTGGSALDAVEAAVHALEDNPIYNAGTGASLTREGNIELDAGIMDGSRLDVGAVADVEHIQHPITLARKVLESPQVLLVGKGAQEFAQEQGIAFCKTEDLLTEHQYNLWKASTEANTSGEEKHGTVGAVALDIAGNLAAATSTGGTPNKYPGRIGDSPLVGCGFYADENAAISCTGHGEDFIRLLIAKRAADFVARGDTARDAAQASIEVLSTKATGLGGLIVVDRLGNIGFAWNSEHMAYAYMSDSLNEPMAGV